VLQLAIPLSQGREHREKELWEAVAYAGRYGHMPLSEALNLSLSDLRKFNAAVGNIVKQENEPRAS